MNKTLVKLSIIYLFALVFNNNLVSSVEKTDDFYDYDYDNNNVTENTTQLVSNTTGFNSTDGYEYDNNEDENESDRELSFIEKVKQLHDEGKNLTISKHVKHINDTFNVLNNLQNVREFLFPINDRTRYEFLEFLSEIDVGLSPECLSATIRIVTSSRNGDLWALKFIDSMGKFPPSGLLEGVLSSFGEYEECLNIKSPPDENKSILKGQYCLTKVILPYPAKDSYRNGEPAYQEYGIGLQYAQEWNIQHMNTVEDKIQRLNIIEGIIYRLGICIPSVCTAQEFETALNRILFPIIRMPLEVGPKCDIKEKPIELNKYQLISLTTLTFLASLVIMSTILEIRQKRISSLFPSKSPIGKDVMLSFSIIRNTKSLFAPNTNFAALDTFRLLLILNVHIAHYYQYIATAGAITLKKGFAEVLQKAFTDNRYVFARSPLMVDALFTLSGFILSYALLKSLDRTKGRFNYFNFLLQRWIRFTLLFFGSILFFYLVPLFGDGPVWEYGLQWITPGCENPKILLKSFLSINNFDERVTPTTHQNCNGPTWFLSALMQLLVIAPIFIITYHRKKILGIYAIVTAIILGLFTAIAPQILFGIKPYLLIWGLDSLAITNTKSFVWYHMTPNVYLVSFSVGIAFGYLLKEKVLFTRFQQIFCWILSLVMISTVYIWHNTFWRFDKSTTILNALIWLSFGKLFFSAGFAWIFYSCCVGKGGFLNRFLSWHGFQPIARLSFGIYLLHFLVVFHRMFTVKDVYVARDSLLIQNLIIDIMKDIVLAFIFYSLIEKPFTNISDYLFRRKPSKNIDHLNDNNDVSKL